MLLAAFLRRGSLVDKFDGFSYAFRKLKQLHGWYILYHLYFKNALLFISSFDANNTGSKSTRRHSRAEGFTKAVST